MDKLKVKLIRSILSQEIKENTHMLELSRNTIFDRQRSWHEGMIEGLQLALNHLEEEES